MDVEAKIPADNEGPGPTNLGFMRVIQNGPAQFVLLPGIPRSFDQFHQLTVLVGLNDTKDIDYVCVQIIDNLYIALLFASKQRPSAAEDIHKGLMRRKKIDVLAAKIPL